MQPQPLTQQRLAKPASGHTAMAITAGAEPTPVWSIDFTRQSPATAGLDFSRASNAGYYNAQGNWVVAPSNTLRVNHNPQNGLCYGYVAEESRTNYLLNSTAPATQTVSLGTGTYTLWLEGTGSCTCTAGTATGSGFGTATAATPVTFTLAMAGTVTFACSGSLNRFQCENGATVTSFITTEASQATRSADICSKTLSINPQQGTFLVTGMLGDNVSLGIDNGAGGSANRIHFSTTTTGCSTYSVMDGAFKAFQSVTETRPRGQVFKMALRYAAGGILTALNGRVIGSSSTSADTLAATTLRLGHRWLPSPTNFLNGHITSVAYFDKAFSQTELQKATY